MDKLKVYLESIDLFVKIALAIGVFLFFGVQKEQVALQQAQLSLTQSQQTQTLVVAEKLIELLFEEKNKCMAEDQAFLLDFLIDTHNAYNKVPINKADFIRVSSGRRACAGGPVSADAKSATEKNDGRLPVVTPDNARQLIRGGTPEAGSAYVAVGAFDAEKRSFRNFNVNARFIASDGSIVKDAVISARWPVYLRQNTNNTSEKGNGVLGTLNEGACVTVKESFPGVRGQTWALVQPVKCP